jgi:hypothetical protein
MALFEQIAHEGGPSPFELFRQKLAKVWGCQ